MGALLNIIVLGLILLIAYWWANQGLFSSILHCLCVMAAGAIALAFWEPLVAALFLKGNGFDNYSWGLTLGILFVGSLFVLRLISDRVAPNNVKFPELVNTVVGGAIGLWAGVLTIGMALIACGFIQAPVEVMGFVGWARAGQSNGAPTSLGSMWIPAANITEGFYSMLSRGALSPVRQTALADYYPKLADTALSLHRDTFYDGDGRAAIAPGSLVIGALTSDRGFKATDDSNGAFALEFTVDSGAFDAGEQFILSAAQARLVSGGKKPEVVFPVQFNQPTGAGERSTYKFDDMSNYATSVPGEQDARIVLVFPAFADQGAIPKFVQIKGARFLLPQPAEGSLAALLGSDEEASDEPTDFNSPDGGFVEDLSRLVMVKNSILPAQLNTNIVAPMTHTTAKDGHYITGGTGTYKKGAQMSVSRSQRIRGFHHTVGTEIILVDASRREGGLDIYGDGSTAFKALGTDKPLELIDTRGKGYKPVGWVWERTGDVEIRFDTSKPVQRISDLPRQPSSGEHKLRLVFVVPTGTEITGFRVGKTVIGRCDVTVSDGGYTD